LYLRGPTSKGRKRVEGEEGNGRKENLKEKGEQEGKREGKETGRRGGKKGKGGKERGRDLPDQCQTASYAPVNHNYLAGVSRYGRP